MCAPPLLSYASRNPRDTTDVRRMCLASTFVNGIGENEAVIYEHMLKLFAADIQNPPQVSLYLSLCPLTENNRRAETSV